MNFFRDLIDLLLPDRCAGCGKAPALLCDACAAPLSGAPRPVRAPAGVPSAWTVAPYEGSVQMVLANYKERGRTPLADPLGRALAHAIQAAAPTGVPLVVVPVPSSRRANRRRGHDPLGGVVDAALQHLRANGLNATKASALRQRRRTNDQAGLSAAERAANLSGALEVTPKTDMAGRRVLLADDVITTGASLAESARALRAAGAEVTAAATLAATPRRSPSW
ncbi:ComF family protein [Actinomadura sp. NEAU-AAG7]|uniref:ComF family protein n=1 Tax=Actinomadura sp. NEAU-AAG7 TaxID=2839640 RepID=UPI001BE47BC1|nr:phosphoribosyltransferase family protein [Actinomadura sp. NEAU-AAG7]MBT2210717.1 ComF family protein [Actinomadura sp. NEAU-AAG7]